MVMPRDAPTPAVDHHVVRDRERYEIVDGVLFAVSPALEPHARRHSKLGALLEAHAAEGWLVAVDMLTRASERNDFAPDASVYPAARDPQTGGRRLERLAFEIVSSETLAHSGRKAVHLQQRGVARRCNAKNEDVKIVAARACVPNFETHSVRSREAGT